MSIRDRWRSNFRKILNNNERGLWKYISDPALKLGPDDLYITDEKGIKFYVKKKLRIKDPRYSHGLVIYEHEDSIYPEKSARINHFIGLYLSDIQIREDTGTRKIPEALVLDWGFPTPVSNMLSVFLLREDGKNEYKRLWELMYEYPERHHEIKLISRLFGNYMYIPRMVGKLPDEPGKVIIGRFKKESGLAYLDKDEIVLETKPIGGDEFWEITRVPLTKTGKKKWNKKLGKIGIYER